MQAEVDDVTDHGTRKIYPGSRDFRGGKTRHVREVSVYARNGKQVAVISLKKSQTSQLNSDYLPSKNCRF